VLDQIPGVGPAVRTSLLRELGSAKRVREASVAGLAAVPKVTPKLAQRIHVFFHPVPAEGEGSPPQGASTGLGGAERPPAAGSPAPVAAAGIREAAP
jgi:excinuclease ABC subunit C